MGGWMDGWKNVKKSQCMIFELFICIKGFAKSNKKQNHASISFSFFIYKFIWLIICIKRHLSTPSNCLIAFWLSSKSGELSKDIRGRTVHLNKTGKSQTGNGKQLCEKNRQFELFSEEHHQSSPSDGWGHIISKTVWNQPRTIQQESVKIFCIRNTSCVWRKS